MTAWFYSDEMVRFLADHQHLSRRALTDAFNQQFNCSKSVKAISSACQERQLHSTQSGCFTKGSKPWNKGLKGEQSMNAGSFRKGNRPSNHQPVGTIATATGSRHLKIKVAEPDCWEFLHHQMWKAHHGDVPTGYVITFIDGDVNNTRIDNLELIPRYELLLRNRLKINNFDPSSRPTIQMLAKLMYRTQSLSQRE